MDGLLDCLVAHGRIDAGALEHGNVLRYNGHNIRFRGNGSDFVTLLLLLLLDGGGVTVVVMVAVHLGVLVLDVVVGRDGLLLLLLVLEWKELGGSSDGGLSDLKHLLDGGPLPLGNDLRGRQVERRSAGREAVAFANGWTIAVLLLAVLPRNALECGRFGRSDEFVHGSVRRHDRLPLLRKLTGEEALIVLSEEYIHGLGLRRLGLLDVFAGNDEGIERRREGHDGAVQRLDPIGLLDVVTQYRIEIPKEDFHPSSRFGEGQRSLARVGRSIPQIRLERRDSPD
mmetsp:Transcript_57475/g.171468  ORF Transcript_57475/g.171468 Transcript_57475/m.171468 type:complete len:284 (+) Transcript_57475:1104-1955(+)